MEKKYYIGEFIGIVLILIFSVLIGIKLYFNEEYYEVPDFKNYSVEELKKELKHKKLKVREVGEDFSSLPVGKIFLQEPEPKEIVKKGRNIKVWVSKGEALIDIPDLDGMSYLDAKILLEKKGLVVDKVVGVKANGNYNEVIATDPQSNRLLTKGERISFLVNTSESYNTVKMPDIIGLSIDEAITILNDNNLILGNIEYTTLEDIQKNVVVKCGVDEGTKLKVGSSIDIVVNQ